MSSVTVARCTPRRLEPPTVTTVAWVLVAVAAACAVADWVAVARGSRRLEYLAKPAATLALVGVALALDPTRDDRRAWFVVALALCLAGDVFLMLPADRFVAGLASFLGGHVAYVIGLTRGGGSAAELAVAAVPVVVVGVAVAVPILSAMRVRGHGALVAPVVAYMAVISAMVTTALASGVVLAALGAALFYGSDALIAWNRFVRPLVWAPVAIMVTYHLGQAGLVLSLAR